MCLFSVVDDYSVKLATNLKNSFSENSVANTRGHWFRSEEQQITRGPSGSGGGSEKEPTR